MVLYHSAITTGGVSISDAKAFHLHCPDSITIISEDKHLKARCLGKRQAKNCILIE